MVKVEIYDSEIEKHISICYLNDKTELGEFISKVHPKVDLNKIPIRKWFVYDIDDSGDYRYDELYSLSDYKENKTNLILSTAKFLYDISKIEHYNYEE